MRRVTAIAVIVSILAASAGEFAHACTMGVSPSPAGTTAGAPVNDDPGGMPCHGADRQVTSEVVSQDTQTPMDCCDGHAPFADCIDCLCAALSMPLSALEMAIPLALPAPVRHALPLSAAPPPERAPEYLLRPPITVS